MEGQNASGGESSLDLTNEKDRATFRNAVKRFPRRVAGVNDERKEQWMRGLDLAGDTAREVIAKGGVLHPVGEGGRYETPLDAATVLINVARTGAAFVKIDQCDDHKEADLAAGVGQGGNTYNVLNVHGAEHSRVMHNPAAHEAALRLAEVLDGLPATPAAPVESNGHVNGNGVHRPDDAGDAQP